jgi:hypothetical protein
MCVNFAATPWFSSVYNFNFSNPWKTLSNPQRRFIQEKYFRVKCLPVNFIESPHVTMWSEDWCMVFRITKSDNRPNVLLLLYQLWTLLSSVYIFLYWIFKWGHFQENGATAHASRVSMTLRLMCSGREKFQRIFGHHGLRNLHPAYHLWGSIQAQFIKATLTHSLNSKKLSQISWGTSLR